MPIAGLDGIPHTDGLTTRYFYDEDLTDGVGFDGALTVPAIDGSGNVSLNITPLLAELTADGVTLGTGSDGSARITVNPENEVSVSISDGTGRSVCSAMLDPADGTPITWNTTLHDTVVANNGFGNVLETHRMDALDHINEFQSDGAGRTLAWIDALGFVTTLKYDSNGNRLKVRDPNNVGQDCVYDRRNRDASCTDTAGDTTSRAYDIASNVITQTDAKGQDTHHVFDARGRRTLTTNRIGGTNQFAYDANNSQLSITDAEFQVTAYEYDVRNLKAKTTYPDHINGSAPGTAGYGITECSYDAMKRRSLCTDQLGDTQTFNYDLASRLLSRDYRTAANSPAGTIADSDTFTYDAASRMLTATSGRYNNVCTTTYDEIGRKASESLTVAGQTYTTSVDYDDASRKTQMTYPDGTVLNRSYTDRNQLHQLNWDGNVVDTRTYDNGQRLQTCSLGNGITDTRAYNLDNTLASISSSNADIGSYSYAWDANKNKTAETITGPLAAYSVQRTASAPEPPATTTKTA